MATTLVSLADYVGRMKDGQDAIYYHHRRDARSRCARARSSKASRKGVEVLLLTDPIDEFWVPAVGEYQGKSFKSVTRGGADLDEIKGDADGRREEAGAGGRRHRQPGRAHASWR